ncbi:MAG: uroporphyrinogen decarboxylase family protein [Anaerolineae bacterium]
MRKAVTFKEPDTVPVGPYLANCTARVANMPVSSYCTSGRKMAEAQLAAWERYQQDIIFPDCDNYYLAEGFGCRTHIPEDDVPSLVQPPLEEPEEVFDLKVPNPESDGRMPVFLEAIEIVASQVGQEVAIRVPGTGPFALASYLIGTERFLREVARVEYSLPGAQPQAVHRMLELATEAVIAFGKAELRAGAHIVQCGDSLASLDMISPTMYEKYAFPYQKRVFATWKEAGAITVLHICGDNTHVLELYAQTGADIVAIDAKVNLGLAKRKIGSKVCLIGNMDPVQTLLFGSVEDVEKEVRQCISIAGPGGGFILGSGCEVPIDTPPQNIEAMVRVAREYEYPLSVKPSRRFEE